jgi:hypothetical protein
VGPGAFDNDDALDPLDALSGQDTAARRQVPEQIFREARAHPENLNFTLGAAEVVAAAAVVAAGLPDGGRRAGDHQHDYDVTALVIPGSDPELASAALAALLITAGHDGAWHRDWTDPWTAAQARRTTDQLASVFYRDQHRPDQELPRSPDGPPHSPPPLIKATSGRHTCPPRADTNYTTWSVSRRQADRTPILAQRATVPLGVRAEQPGMRDRLGWD